MVFGDTDHGIMGEEIRAVHRIENRSAATDKVGLKKIIVSKYPVKGLDMKKYQT